MRGGDEAFEERVGLMRFAVEFGMKLAGDKEGMLGQFDDLNQLAVRSKAAESKAGFLELVAIRVVELVAMAVAFVDDKGAIEPRGFCAHDQLARLGAEAHGAAFFGDFGLLIEYGDDRIRSVEVEFGGVRFGEF